MARRGLFSHVQIAASPAMSSMDPPPKKVPACGSPGGTNGPIAMRAIAPSKLITTMRGPHRDGAGTRPSSPVTPFNRSAGSIRFKPRTAHQTASSLIITEATKPMARLVDVTCKVRNDPTPGVGHNFASK